ncbi:unnamed protein product [Adineta steineri]|uniref:Uncharacterized protein n=1 Tax=Adineta steineri TaxID=433720 RepID=A0A820KH03_9BILA|nr:unnamed protein product [Adineta steineri]CAF4096926.1 unnamed protein product [Adineta steineri]CAF4343323.1 unnamed protein product [Adineta steineri]
MLKPRFSNCSDNLSNVVILRNSSACRQSSVPAEGDVILVIVCNNAGLSTSSLGRNGSTRLKRFNVSLISGYLSTT